MVIFFILFFSNDSTTKREKQLQMGKKNSDRKAKYKWQKMGTNKNIV